MPTRKTKAVLAAAGVVCGVAVVIAVVASLRPPPGGTAPAPAPLPLARQADGVDGALVLGCPTAADYDRFALMIGRKSDWTAAKRGRCIALEDQPAGRMPYEHYHMYRVVERSLDYACVRRAFKEENEAPCYWTAAANLRHIDSARLSEDEFRRVEELAGEEHRLEATAADLRLRANKAETDHERRQLATLAEQAERRSRDLHGRIVAIRPQ